MLREAGELRIPFTTGILIGIGETLAERVDSLLAIRDLHRALRPHPGGHRPELPRQADASPHGRRARARRRRPGAHHRRRAPHARPRRERAGAAQPLARRPPRCCSRAGINDWGGISPLTPDYVNPEAPWPHVTALAATCRAAGFTLAERLPIYPAYVDAPRLPRRRRCGRASRRSRRATLASVTLEASTS